MSALVAMACEHCPRGMPATWPRFVGAIVVTAGALWAILRPTGEEDRPT